MIYIVAVAGVLVLPALFLPVYVALRAAHTRPGVPGTRTHSALDRVVLAGLTRAIRTGLRAGVRLGPMVMLTVRGRTTGLPRSNPVDLWQDGAHHYLIATHDDTAAWVRNLRAAGDGTVRLGRRRWQFTAAELPQQQAGKVIERVLAPRIRRPLAGFVLRQTLAIAPDGPTDGFVATAARHPVFELTITNGPIRTPRPGRHSQTTLAKRLPAALIPLGLTVATVHLGLGLAHKLDAAGWISGVAIGLLLAGAGNHLRIFGPRETPTDHAADSGENA